MLILKNYQEIYNWIMQLGPGVSADDYRTLTGQANTGAFVTTPGDELKMYSDATLMILNSDYNPTVRIKFKDVFPISLSAGPFDATQEQQTYYTATASFRYTIFDVIDVNGKKV